MTPEPTELLGRWRLRRVIDDRAAGATLTVEGVTELALDGGAIRWTEHGELTGPAGVVPVLRTLLVTREAEGWLVRFADGRAFHPWLPGVEVVHECAPDRYVGRVTGDRDAWRVVWEVTGPAKRYRSDSRLTPAGAAAVQRGTTE